MIITIVQIPWVGPERELATFPDEELESTKFYRNMKGVNHKHYTNGELGGGDISVFDTRKNAEAWFHDDRADWIEGHFGVQPNHAIFDNCLTLNNDADEVRVNGEAVTPPLLTDAAT